MKSIYILNTNSHFILLLFWFVNDVFLKVAFPGFVTGKLSDIIGIYLSPFILTSILKLVFPKVHERILFILTTSVISIIFLLINLSQEFNDRVYSLLEFGSQNKGYADFTDLPCLGVIIFSYLKFNNFHPNNRKAKGGRLVLLLSFITFINSPREPTGRSDAFSYLILITSAADTIYLEAPNNGKIADTIEPFSYRFVGQNNESSPRSLESLTIPSECLSISNIPTDTSSSVGSLYGNSPPSMKFQNFLIRISKNSNLVAFELEKVCEPKNCSIDLSKLVTGDYYWKVYTQYTYIQKCILYRYTHAPNQIPEKFKL